MAVTAICVRTFASTDTRVRRFPSKTSQKLEVGGPERLIHKLTVCGACPPEICVRAYEVVPGESCPGVGFASREL